MPSTAGSTDRARPVPAAEHERFDRDGYLIIRGALTPDEVSRYAAALDRTYAAATSGGRVQPGASMHQLSAVANCQEAAGLLDHPSTFRYVWSLLGWNIHVYHSHLDVHPPLPARRPFRFEWHQDGGRRGRGDRVPWRCRPVRPEAVARQVRQLLAAYAEGHFLRLHVPVGRDQGRERRHLVKRLGRPAQPGSAAAARRARGRRRRPRVGPLPVGHAAVRLLEAARPSRRGQSAAQAVALSP
jgi:Phytanoyl-CoA dioxygenase (PhyH)